MWPFVIRVSPDVPIVAHVRCSLVLGVRGLRKSPSRRTTQIVAPVSPALVSPACGPVAPLGGCRRRSPAAGPTIRLVATNFPALVALRADRPTGEGPQTAARDVDHPSRCPTRSSCPFTGLHTRRAERPSGGRPHAVTRHHDHRSVWGGRAAAERSNEEIRLGRTPRIRPATGHTAQAAQITTSVKEQRPGPEARMVMPLPHSRLKMPHKWRRLGGAAGGKGRQALQVVRLLWASPSISP